MVVCGCLVFELEFGVLRRGMIKLDSVSEIHTILNCKPRNLYLGLLSA